MNNRGVKLSNDYASVFHQARVYDRIPKAIFAAVALSFAEWAPGHECELDKAVNRVLAEWQTLHQNGLVPQPLPRDLAELAKAGRREMRADGDDE